MKQLFSLLFIITYSALNAQQFNLVDGGLALTDAKGAALNNAVFEECWCYPVYNDSTGTLANLKANVYPVPVKLNGNWSLLTKEGVLEANHKSIVPYLKTATGIAEIINFQISNHVWSVDSASYLSVLDTSFVEQKRYHVKDIYRGSFLASEDNYYWGLLDSKLKTLVKFEYASSHHVGEYFQFSSEGYLTLRENKPEGYNGIVDYTGKVHIPFKWKLLSYIAEDTKHIYAMNENLKRGYLNIKGETVLPFIFDKIPRELTDSNFVVTKDYMWYVDGNLKQIGVKYQSLEKKGDLWFFKKDNKWGIMDEAYKVIIPNIYSSIMDGPRIKDNADFKCYVVVKSGLYGLVTLTGESIIKPAYECLCGLSYYAPSAYYIEFKKADISYKFDEKGTLIEKGGKGSPACFCE